MFVINVDILITSNELTVKDVGVRIQLGKSPKKIGKKLHS